MDLRNASGQMIGIISHVKALKERIAAQIRVEKGGAIGLSRLVVQGPVGLGRIDRKSAASPQVLAALFTGSHWRWATDQASAR